ncbi:MAG TPA: hypothetical protein VFF76_04825 [Holophagaceae bacterium]|jgi:hypothetical protein|nr:hypothetical protein [Holophagaceae bacterium]
MNADALRLAAELGGTRLSGPGGPLVLVERIRAHGLPALAVLGREPEHFRDALDAWDRSDAPINLAAIVSLPGTDLAGALAAQRRRIGAVTAALDASLPWLENKPMLAKRLPGRVAREVRLEPAQLGPLETAELRAFLDGWDEAGFRETFISSASLLWPDTAPPAPERILVPPLRLAVGGPLLDALRDALRRALNRPIPLLPLPEDPSGLHALRLLSEHVAAFRGPATAWELALRSIATLPAPPHFCARC